MKEVMFNKEYPNGLVREVEKEHTDAQYWQNVPYDEAVNTEIRKKYSESQEFAILRQRDEKPEEYAEYYAYCEECKGYVKELFDLYGVEYETE